jgi:hypothetical protein
MRLDCDCSKFVPLCKIPETIASILISRAGDNVPKLPKMYNEFLDDAYVYIYNYDNLFQFGYTYYQHTYGYLPEEFAQFVDFVDFTMEVLTDVNIPLYHDSRKKAVYVLNH